MRIESVGGSTSGRASSRALAARKVTSLGHAIVVGDAVGELKRAALVHRERAALNRRRAILDDPQRICVVPVGVLDCDSRIAVEHGLVAADHVFRIRLMAFGARGERLRSAPLAASLGRIARHDAHGELAPLRTR